MLKLFQSKSKIGFTLIELLVVIAIIGVLASIVLASLNNARRKSRDARRITDVKQIQLAMELYFDANLGNDGIAANTGLSYPADIYGAGILAPNYIAIVPTDPSGGATPQYRYADLASSATPLVVCSAAGPCLYYHLGANLEENGTDANGAGGNPALASDRDLDTSGVGGFDGLDPDCPTTASASAADGCYDITP